MNFLSIIVILLIAFLLWVVWGFLKYKRNEKQAKAIIYECISKGMSLHDAVHVTFANLNQSYELGLSENTVQKIADKISGLTTKMDLDNAIEIYATFLHRYIFRDGPVKKPQGVSDEKVRYAIESMQFDERNGYFVIKYDSGEDFDLKYPERN